MPSDRAASLDEEAALAVNTDEVAASDGVTSPGRSKAQSCASIQFLIANVEPLASSS